MANKRILLVNPNTYRTPAVIPVGLEYIGSALEQAGWEVRVLDLCFEDDPSVVAERVAIEYDPLFICMTIRNIDSGLYQNNVFFLPGVKDIAAALKKSGAPLVVGGAGFVAAPEAVVDYVGADYGVAGPGVKAVVEIAKTFAAGKTPPRITDGWRAGIDPDFVPKRPLCIDYERYLGSEGIIGFATQYGCNGTCDYCIEAGRKVLHRNPEAVVAELKQLVDMGYSSFHLCDSEYNLNLEFSEKMAAAIADADLPLTWALYMKPAPWSEKLFRELKRSKANLVTMSVETRSLGEGTGRYNFDDLKKIFALCDDIGIRIAVDLITGLPGEPESHTIEVVDFFKEHTPATIGVNAFIRLCRGTPVTERIIADEDMKKLIVMAPKDEAFLSPVFYCQLPAERIIEMIGKHPAFRMEGLERVTNYQIVN